MKAARWRQIESLYNQAVQMDETQRTAFLRGSCGGDEDLQRDLEELLAEEPQAASFLECAAIKEIAHEFAATMEPPRPSWIGRQIGNYEFLSLVGVGGMGEVYRAHDSKLKRDVAIKVLPDEFLSEPDRVSRFQREAQLLASLNHPNIAAIYDLEEADGHRFLILELVEGETLANRIKHGLVPVEDALKIALQTAEALEAAHEKNVIHRDLKPANIKITPEGKVKVLDFGLAKALLGANGSDLPNSQTVSITGTQQGVILGPAAYMSPEQARGQAVDRRTDVWAFGCVLYEMLTGRPAFNGEGASDILASVLKSEPDWDRLPGDTPASIRRLLRRCLRKDRNRRLQTLGDARIEIEETGTEPELAGPATMPAAPRRRQVLRWIAAGTGVAALNGLGLWYFRRPPEELESLVWGVDTPPTPDPMSFALSPDGRRLVFVAGDNEPQLWLQPLDSINPAQPLAGTEGATSPFWKPDSQSIAFFARGKLKRIDVGGRVASPQILASMNVLLSRGGAWSPDGFILFPRDAISALSRVQDSPGGKLEPVTTLEAGHSRHSFPCFLPGGRQFLFFVQGPAEVQGIYIGSVMDPTKIERVVASESAGAYLDPGWLLFVSQKALVARRFDLATNKASGATVEFAAPVGLEGGAGAFSVSATGRVAYRAPVAGGRQLRWFDRDKNLLDAFDSQDKSDMASPAVSPEGRRVAVRRRGAWILDLALQPLASGNSGGSPIWSSNGKWIAFYNGLGLFVKPSLEKGEQTLIVGPPEFKAPCDWYEDSLLYFKVDSKTGLRSLWVQQVSEQDGKPVGGPKEFLNHDWDEFNGRFSPSGLFVAYQSNESKTLEINVVPFSGKGNRVQVSTGGGIWPRWSPDGTELYYLRLDGMLVSVSLTVKGTEIERGATRDVLRPPIVGFNADVHTGYDVALKGDRRGQFLIIGPVQKSVTSRITLVQHWKPPTTA